MAKAPFLSSRLLSRWALLLGCCSVLWFGTRVASRRLVVLRSLSTADDPEASCGPVSLGVVAQWYGRNPSIDELNKLTHVGDSGLTSLRDLGEAASEIGLSARAVRLDPDGPLPWKLPMILHLRENHFAAVLPVDADRLVMVDLPDEGPRVIARRALRGDWMGRALVLADSRAAIDTALGRAGLIKELTEE